MRPHGLPSGNLCRGLRALRLFQDESRSDARSRRGAARLLRQGSQSDPRARLRQSCQKKQKTPSPLFRAGRRKIPCGGPEKSRSAYGFSATGQTSGRQPYSPASSNLQSPCRSHALSLRQIPGTPRPAHRPAHFRRPAFPDRHEFRGHHHVRPLQRRSHGRRGRGLFHLAAGFPSRPARHERPAHRRAPVRPRRPPPEAGPAPLLFSERHSHPRSLDHFRPPWGFRAEA